MSIFDSTWLKNHIHGELRIHLLLCFVCLSLVSLCLFLNTKHYSLPINHVIIYPVIDEVRDVY